MSTTRERLHELLDAMPDERLADVEAALESMADPVLFAFLSAPEDDEDTTEEDIRALDAARREYEDGETVSLDEAMQELSEAQTP